MSIGLFRGTVILEPHSIEWEANAQQNIAGLKAILGETITDAQHIGSTSIREICAKPIIDIAVGADDTSAVLSMNDKLEKSGFLFRGQDHPGQYLYICGEGSFITHHIHLVRYGSETWHNYVNMRDYLNCHSDDAKAYAELKQSLAEKYPDNRNKYTELKSDLINEILAKAKKWRNKTVKTSDTGL